MHVAPNAALTIRKDEEQQTTNLTNINAETKQKSKVNEGIPGNPNPANIGHVRETAFVGEGGRRGTGFSWSVNKNVKIFLLRNGAI